MPDTTKHTPTEESKRQVFELITLRTPQETIAKIMGMSINTLRKHYGRELEHGLVVANGRIAGKVYDIAMEGNVAAMKFWLETRAGWSRSQKIEHKVEHQRKSWEEIANQVRDSSQ